MNSGQLNSVWQTRVKTLLSKGYGVEDIAIKTGVDVQHVRNEVAILRDDGALYRMFQA